MNNERDPQTTTHEPRLTTHVLQILALAGYLMVIATVIGLLYFVRQRALAEFTTDQAQRDWDHWREHSGDPGPVQRRRPKSDRPPTLVLLSDYFGMCLAAGIVFTSLLYGILYIFIRGALSSAPVSSALGGSASRTQ